MQLPQQQQHNHQQHDAVHYGLSSHRLSPSQPYHTQLTISSAGGAGSLTHAPTTPHQLVLGRQTVTSPPVLSHHNPLLPISVQRDPRPPTCVLLRQVSAGGKAPGAAQHQRHLREEEAHDRDASMRLPGSAAHAPQSHRGGSSTLLAPSPVGHHPPRLSMGLVGPAPALPPTSPCFVQRYGGDAGGASQRGQPGGQLGRDAAEQDEEMAADEEAAAEAVGAGVEGTKRRSMRCVRDRPSPTWRMLALPPYTCLHACTFLYNTQAHLDLLTS